MKNKYINKIYNLLNFKILEKIKNKYKFFLIVFLLIIFLLYNIFANNLLSLFNKKNNYILFDETIKNFININNEGLLINDDKKFQKIRKPKISIVITVRNGAGCIKTAVRSVQNQDFINIEIIIIDDNSEDDSVKIIKELMNKDPRIVFLQNNENKGALYTKTKGVLNSKGKYVLILDVDDLYAIKNAFSILYEEAEKNNLDILGFTAIQGRIADDGFHGLSFHNYFDTSIIYQPEISERSHIKNEKGEIIGLRDVLWCYFFRTDFFIKSINEINLKFLNRINNGRDDIFVFFLLVKRAKSLKHIKKILYVTIQQVNLNNPLMKNFSEKNRSFRNKYGCWDNISYIELVLIKSNNNYQDKKIASFAIRYFLLDNNECRQNKLIRKVAIDVCKL